MLTRGALINTFFCILIKDCVSLYAIMDAHLGPVYNHEVSTVVTNGWSSIINILHILFSKKKKAKKKKKLQLGPFKICWITLSAAKENQNSMTIIGKCYSRVYFPFCADHLSEIIVSAQRIPTNKKIWPRLPLKANCVFSSQMYTHSLYRWPSKTEICE